VSGKMRDKQALLQQQEELQAQLKRLQESMKLADSLNEAESIFSSSDIHDISMSLTISTENSGKTTIKDMPSDLVQEIKELILLYNSK
jgi:hypothetical protein